MTELSAIAMHNEVDDLPLWRDEVAYGVLTDTLQRHEVNEEIFAKLVAASRNHAHKQRTRGITADFDEIFQSLAAER